MNNASLDRRYQTIVNGGGGGGVCVCVWGGGGEATDDNLVLHDFVICSTLNLGRLLVAWLYKVVIRVRQ